MPICKNCGTRLDKFNKDICPVCGQVHPFEGVSSDTVEITTSIEVQEKDYNPRKKKTALILFILLGFFGTPFFYLYEYKKAYIYTAVNVVGIAVLTFLFNFYAEIAWYFALLIGFGILMLVNTGFGLYFFFLPNQKDGRGEFLI